jgi:hypothetical protein
MALAFPGNVGYFIGESASQYRYMPGARQTRPAFYAASETQSAASVSPRLTAISGSRAASNKYRPVSDSSTGMTQLIAAL